VVDAIPRLPSGKALRRVLNERFRERFMERFRQERDGRETLG
jgi:acyl-CoA synthetase (AMP-forming)/AMP-acid ligase II